MQLDVPEGVKPVSHVGVQVAPLAREAVQSPTPPSVGAVLASHGSGGQRADLLPGRLPSLKIKCTFGATIATKCSHTEGQLLQDIGQHAISTV